MMYISMEYCGAIVVILPDSQLAHSFRRPPLENEIERHGKGYQRKSENDVLRQTLF